MSLVFGQQKERTLNQESLGGSKLCLAEADEAKNQDGSRKDTNPVEDLGHLITEERRETFCSAGAFPPEEADLQCPGLDWSHSVVPEGLFN